MNAFTVVDFIKARWRMIAVLAVVSLIAILVFLFVAGLLLFPSETTFSGGAVTYYANNSTG